MKYVRFSDPKGNISYGSLDGDGILKIEGDIFSEHYITDQRIPLEEARLLAPCVPSKILGLGMNYYPDTSNVQSEKPRPVLFMKTSNTVIGPYDDIIYPANATEVHFECELGVVIGKTCSGIIQLEEAMDFVFGYTCVNDVSERGMQTEDGQWSRGKCVDTFSPMGPCISTDCDPFHSKVETRLNGEVRQSSSTDRLVMDVPHLISSLARNITMYPGDVIATGTPACIGGSEPKLGEMRIGDVCEVEVEGIGTICNRVVAEK